LTNRPVNYVARRREVFADPFTVVVFAAGDYVHCSIGRLTYANDYGRVRRALLLRFSRTRAVAILAVIGYVRYVTNRFRSGTSRQFTRKNVETTRSRGIFPDENPSFAFCFVLRKNARRVCATVPNENGRRTKQTRWARAGNLSPS